VHIANWHTKWIIGGIFREAAEAYSLKPVWRIYPTSKKDFLDLKVILSRVHSGIGQLNVYAHQDTYFSVFETIPEQIRHNRNRVYFTHFNQGQILTQEQISALEYCEKILVQNEAMQNYLISKGVSTDKIVRIPGAVNREIFKPVNRIPEDRYVLFSGDFKYRKNPDLIAKVITHMPDIDFVIHGKNWDSFPPELLRASANLTRLDFDLGRQASLIRQASLYVSLSLVEGGPYPILEALASGTPVVATDTGFCAEFINSDNGILLPNPPELSSVLVAIRQSLDLKDFTWNQDLLKGKWQWKDLGGLIFH
jgi:glycosyltransferase involved in cell wall biosynthesis